jgi:hypothetical protein
MTVALYKNCELHLQPCACVDNLFMQNACRKLRMSPEFTVSAGDGSPFEAVIFCPALTPRVSQD